MRYANTFVGCLLLATGCGQVPPQFHAAGHGVAAINNDIAFRKSHDLGVLCPYKATGVQIAPGTFRCRTITYDDVQVHFTVTWVPSAERHDSRYQVSDVLIERPTIKL